MFPNCPIWEQAGYNLGMKQYIYSRVSTDKQDNQNQLNNLQHLYPNAEVVTETCSGVKSRPKLKALLQTLQDGDSLIVAALDRLGRKTSEVLVLIESLQSKGINVVSIREGLDYSTVTGRLVSQIMVSVAEMERGLISERTKAALKAKKAQGVKLGRPRLLSPETYTKVIKLRQQGKTYRTIARITGISLKHAYSICKAA